ncbi:MAG: IS110 family transposase [Oscillospiraceae bacterium]
MIDDYGTNRVAGLDAPPYQSGNIDVKSRSISKRDSPHLRKALFQVIDVILKNSSEAEPVYRFLDKKRAEGNCVLQVRHIFLQ